MTDNNKFKSKQELNEYIKNNSTSFEEFEKRLDYSRFEKNSNKRSKSTGFSWKRLGYTVASLVLIISITFGIHFFTSIGSTSKCPYELGTYTYYSQEGDIEGLNFDEDSYIVLTDKELSGPGTFTLEGKDWIVYGQFYECEFENQLINDDKGTYFIDNIQIKMCSKFSNNVNQILVNIDDSDEHIKIIFILQN